jgi:hypothetical protein
MSLAEEELRQREMLLETEAEEPQEKVSEEKNEFGRRLV